MRSAGLRDKWVGKGAHTSMIETADRFGYDLAPHRGVHITPGLVGWATLVLAMDRAVMDTLDEAFGARIRGKLRLYLDGQDVPDPFGGPAEAFTSCAALIQSGAVRYGAA